MRLWSAESTDFSTAFVIREGCLRLSITLCTKRLDTTNREMSFFSISKIMWTSQRFHRSVIPIIPGYTHFRQYPYNLEILGNIKKGKGYSYVQLFNSIELTVGDSRLRTIASTSSTSRSTSLQLILRTFLLDLFETRGATSNNLSRREEEANVADLAARCSQVFSKILEIVDWKFHRVNSERREEKQAKS